MKMIELKNVSKIYKVGEKKVYGVRNLDLVINEGEFVVVIGPSGCGKSTLLNLIGGLDKPSEGEIIVDGKNLSNLNDKELTNTLGMYLATLFNASFENILSPPPTILATLKRNIAERLRRVFETM